MQYFAYTKIIENGPDGTALHIKFDEDPQTKEKIGCELGVVDGITYISLPDGKNLPEQDPRIKFAAIEMTDALKSQIKGQSSFCRMISNEMISKIREKYSIDDEAYFSRIGVGAALGMYQFAEGEREQLTEFGTFVESVRQWGRSQRELVGL